MEVYNQKSQQAFLAVEENFTPHIKVIGAGGGGGNVIAKLVEFGAEKVDYIACNTDLKALNRTQAKVKIELGKQLTRGLGAGANPEVGAKATQESLAEIENYLQGADMMIIAAGMGGGTGTGAAPLIAKAAKAKQILTVGIVTLPFSFEGRKRRRVAEEGVRQLYENTDTLLIIPNDKLLQATDRTTKLLDAFHLVDEVLINAIQGITELINNVGLINVDFADVKTIMENMGKAVIGKGVAFGEQRMEKAVYNAIHSPLMQDTDIRGATGILIHIIGSENMSLMEINQAVSYIEELADDDVNLIFGASTISSMEDEVAITVIATGLQ